MRNLAKFIGLLELTREQPMYGYFLSGVRSHETSNLAEHHYLVTMIAWMLCEYVNEETRLIDTDAVLRMCLVHDLGELFGGDMAAPLSRLRPDMKQHARAIEAANYDIITRFLSPRMKDQLTMWHQKGERREGDEGIVAKFADLIETHYFLEHVQNTSPHKEHFYFMHIRPLVEQIRDERIRVKLQEFCQGFEEYVRGRGFSAGTWVLNGK